MIKAIIVAVALSIAPQAQRHMRHGEGSAQVRIQGARHASLVAGLDQGHGEAVHLAGYGIVLLAEANQLDQLGFECAHLVASLDEVAELRMHQVDSRRLLVGEHDAAVDDDEILGGLDRQTVHADLAEPPERDDAQGRRGQGTVIRLNA